LLCLSLVYTLLYIGFSVSVFHKKLAI
jgi:hypothetical protein